MLIGPVVMNDTTTTTNNSNNNSNSNSNSTKTDYIDTKADDLDMTMINIVKIGGSPARPRGRAELR